MNVGEKLLWKTAEEDSGENVKYRCCNRSLPGRILGPGAELGGLGFGSVLVKVKLLFFHT